MKHLSLGHRSDNGISKESEPKDMAKEMGYRGRNKSELGRNGQGKGWKPEG
jgi:hypothetical protein